MKIDKIFTVKIDTAVEVPLYTSNVQAGFPSPADDSIERSIDLNREFIRDQACTYFVIANGDSMSGDGITEGDLLLVDRSIDPYDGCVAICYYDGGFTVKRLLYGEGGITLQPSNPKYKEITVQEGEELTIWGVVCSVHKNLRRKK